MKKKVLKVLLYIGLVIILIGTLLLSGCTPVTGVKGDKGDTGAQGLSCRSPHGRAGWC